MRFVTFVKSNAKALLTLRIKSPLRSAEGISRCGASRWRVFLVGGTPPFWTFQAQNRKTSHCVPARSLRNTAYCARSQHASMWTISSLARIFPYATSIEILVATASATSFLSSAVMYLWGQFSYIRRYCRRVFRVVTSHFGSL